jgi:geranylgeranyl reductase family protein
VSLPQLLLAFNTKSWPCGVRKMPIRETIAVVGGGPAGAFAAEQLTGAGRKIILFDEKLAWEKPCGGGLTDKAITRWPFLRDAQAERNWISDCELISPSGRKVSFQLDRQIAIFSRKVLNKLLLDRAREAGAEVHRARVLKIERSGKRWTIETASKTFAADFVVLATGARNSFRSQFSQAFGPENFMVAVGYYIPGTNSTVRIKFLKQLHGYIWVFPRSDHFSVGICGNMEGGSTATMRRVLEDSLPELGLSLDGAQFYAHIIPALTPKALQSSFAGNSWALIGDAAGFVDRITGEGIYYTLRSAELLANALLHGAPENYSESVRRDFLPELDHAARVTNRFYSGNWMGGSVIERMIQLTGRSPRFRELMRDLFAGTQEYSSLRDRLYRSLPRIAVEALVSTLWQPRDAIPRAGNPQHASLD